MATRSIVLKWIARNQNVDWAHLAWELATLYGARPIRLATLTGEEGSGACGTWLGNGHIIRTKLTRKNEHRTVPNRTQPNRTDPQRTAPKTNALSDVGSHAFCDRKSSCWGVEKSHVKCCNCCKLLLRLGNMAAWQTSDWSWVGLAQAPGSVYCYVWSRVQFPIHVVSFLALPRLWLH